MIYNTYQFSYNYLAKIQTAVGELMPRYSLHSVGIAPQNNQVNIRLSDEKFIEEVSKSLSELSLYEPEAIKFFVEEPPSLQSRTIHSGQYADSVKDGEIRGGTISAKAICNQTGQMGIITNEHVAPKDSIVRDGGEHIFFGGKGFQGTGTVIGTSTKTKFGGKVDAAFIPFNDSNSWQFTSSATYWTQNKNNQTVIPRTYKVADHDEIVVGLPIAKFGTTTGRVDGVITEVGAFISMNFAYFTDQIRHTARCDDGDSGGPVFITLGGKYTLAGIHFSGAEGINGYANKITRVAEALDVTILGEVESPVKNGAEYRIRNISTNQYVTVEGSNTGTGMRVMQASYNGSVRQTFYARTNSDGSFSLEPNMNRNAGKNNTRVDLSYVFPSYNLLKIQTANTNDRQKFRLVNYEIGSRFMAVSGGTDRSLEPLNSNEIHEMGFQQSNLRQRWVFELVQYTGY